MLGLVKSVTNWTDRNWHAGSILIQFKNWYRESCVRRAIQSLIFTITRKFRSCTVPHHAVSVPMYFEWLGLAQLSQ